jgi:hypothetical protein
MFRCSQGVICVVHCFCLQQAEASPGLLAKLGRVIKEKAAGDYERCVHAA